MDIEQLILKVFACPAIWNSREVKHSDRLYVAKQWDIIAEKLGVGSLYYRNITVVLYIAIH